MNIGRFHVEQLSEGQFEIFEDGTINRKPVNEKSDRYSDVAPSRKSAKIGINPILVSDANHHVLLDTGLGWGLDAGSPRQDISNIATNLSIFDISPKDITHVVLTHLHYDHAAGASYTGATGVTKATFPNATYYIQKKEWETALSQIEQDNKVPGAGYHLDDLYRLVADGQIEFIDEESYELIPGINLIRTGGHTNGHQIVQINDGDETACYFGDLLPNEHHLNTYSMHNMDEYPLQAKKMKIRLLKKAYKENALLLFYHSLHSKVGHLDRDRQKNYVLKNVE